MNDAEQWDKPSREAFEKFSTGKFEEAIELYNASLDVAPNAQSLRGLGECYSALGRYREAILYYAASAGLRPFPKASFQLAEALCKCGFLDEAKRAAERALEAMPHYRGAHELLAEINNRLAEGGNPSSD